MKTLQAALSAANTAAGTHGYVEVWVAGGQISDGTTNHEYTLGDGGSGSTLPFTIGSNVALYGGFLGNETSKSQRHWEIYQTILSGNGSGSGPIVIANANSAAIDGFIIQKGDIGIKCNTGAAPLIAHNIIKTNDKGILLCSSSSTIGDNLLTANLDGIDCQASNPDIINNTIAQPYFSQGFGIRFDSSSSANIYNNIIYDYSIGIDNAAITMNSSQNIFYNDTYGADTNDPTVVSQNYTGVVPDASQQNISADPLFTGYGDYHLSAQSPCIDTGYDGQLPNDIDLDNNPRIATMTCTPFPGHFVS